MAVKTMSYVNPKNFDKILQDNLEDITDIRIKYKDDSIKASNILRLMLNEKGYMAETLTFRGKNGVIINGCKYHYYCVVMLGKYVLDMLNSSELIKTVDYIGALQKNSEDLNIETALSTGWYNEKGEQYKPTIDDLLNKDIY